MAHLSDDLVAIRDAKGITSQDIASKTRFPDGILREIETGILFNQPDTQRTYIRSFVRSYAKAIRIEEKDIVRALDEYYADGYTGFLKSKYIEGILEEGEQVEMLKRIITTSTLGAEEFTRPDPTRAHNQMTPPPPDLTNVNWSNMGAEISILNPRVIAMAVIAFILGTLVVSGIYTNGFGLFEESTDPVADTNTIPTPIPSTPIPTPADSISISDTTSIPLPDTLDVLIYAAFDRLEPVRVQTDFGTEVYPYWIEQGTAMRFEFNDQISIRGAFPRFVLLFNGHVIPNKENYMVGGNMITIRRADLESQPLFRTATPDSLDGNLPYPTTIVERPVFRP